MPKVFQRRGANRRWRFSARHGFIISADGWILTAAHVVLDESNQTVARYSTVSVVMPDGLITFATLMSPIEPNMAARDYAILKVDGKDLPHFDLAEKPDDIVIGSDLTIIGYPFSALGFHSDLPSIKDKFCLSGTVAGLGQTNVSVNSRTAKGEATVNVNVDVVYFEGPSIKGLSGSPVISRDTGHVIAILTNKLTGIGPALAETRKNIGTRTSGLIIDSVDVTRTTAELIDTLDTQLANGLGAGTGIEDVKSAYRHLLREQNKGKKR